MTERAPIVFIGPSAAGLSPQQRSAIDVRPPVRRGDLHALTEQPPRPVLIVDGLFGWSMAVSPAECRDLMVAGWTLCGAASMGALRAAELWTLGMVGLGRIFEQLRLGRIECDDEVAVAYHPDEPRELGASLVHVRSVLRAARERGFEPSQLQAVFELARARHWQERSWKALWSDARAAKVSAALIDAMSSMAEDPQLHPKLHDARYAVEAVLGQGLWFSQR